MQSKILIIASVAVAAVGLSTPASAQMMQRGKSPIRIKFGGFIPGTSTTRKAVKSLYLGGGLTYDLARTAPDSAVLSAYLDINGDDNGDATLQSRIFSVGLGGEYRFYVLGAKSPLKFYLGSGAGLYIVASQGNNVTGFRVDTRDKTFGKFGGKLLGGMELRSGFFGELSYTSITSTNYLNAGGLSAVLGFRL